MSGDPQLGNFVTKLRRREVVGSYLCARETAELMRKVVGGRWKDISKLVEKVLEVGNTLQSAAPHELAIGNVARHVVHIIRKVYSEAIADERREDHKKSAKNDNDTDCGNGPSNNASLAASSASSTYSSSSSSLNSSSMILAGGSASGGASPSLSASSSTDKPKLSSLATPNTHGVMTMSMQDLLLYQERSATSTLPAPRKVKEFRQEVIGVINEFLCEITDIHANVADMATEHIHANEVIMTFGQSNTVSAFLEAAASKIYFDVIVCESAPTFRGHAVVKRLSKSGIMTTLIPDSAIFAMMGRCNKVIMGTHAVLANGGLIAPAGSALVAAAAKHHSVPVIVVTGLYKLSPLYPHDLNNLTDFRSPSQLMSFSEAGGLTNTEFHNPGFDYISPDKVGLFVSHLGGATPSYVYRLLAEYYD